MKKCKLCNYTGLEGFWFLSNYYGISGRFCSKCYDKIAHDSYGNPINPAYSLILLQLNSK